MLGFVMSLMALVLMVQRLVTVMSGVGKMETAVGTFIKLSNAAHHAPSTL